MIEKNGEKIITDLHNIISEEFKNADYEDGCLRFFEENDNASGKFVKFKTKGKCIALSLDKDDRDKLLDNRRAEIKLIQDKHGNISEIEKEMLKILGIN